MRSRMRLVTLAVATALVAGWANAQTKHEFGVDVQLANAKPDGGDGVTSLGTPVDVRIGFAGSSALMWETRFSLLYSKPKDGSLFLFQPDLNALWHIGGATPIKGAYLTAGVGINYLSVDPGTPGSSSESSTRIGFNGGIGQ